MLNGARAVQVFDEYHIRFLNDYCVHAPIMVIPNGFNPLEVLAFRPGEKAGRPWNRDTNAEFLFLGRIDMRTKGLDLLFLALSRGIREGKIPESLRLKIVGPDFGDKAKLVCLADQLSIAKSVTFCDGVDEQRRWSVVTSSDLLVLPSRHDAFPTVVLEAMAAGTPVIVSENTGMSSWVRKAQCGLLVQPTVESICAGLVSALDCREHWRTMGEAGRNYAYSYLTWERVGHEASRCYEKLLGHANGKSDFQAVQSPEGV